MDELLKVLTEAIGSVYRHELAVFAVATMLVSIFIWLLDLVSTKLLQRSSLLGVGYGGIRSVKSLLLWGVGAGLAAYVGGLFELINIQSLSSKIIVGVGWPTVLPRLIAMSTQEKEPEQSEEVEEEEQE